MTADELIQALGLPESTRLNQRVPKKLLAEHGAATAADKRLVQDGVDEILWLASLKPHLIGVPAYRDEQREYLEVAVLSLALKPGTKPDRLAELLHRAVPYPMVLLTSTGAGLYFSLAHLRASQNEAEKTVVDGEVQLVALPADGAPAGFLGALALARQPQAQLHALYQGWLEALQALDIARETGQFQPSQSREQATARHAALQEHRRVRACIEQLHAQASKERQMARQVQLNSEIRDLTQQLAALAQQLQGEPS